jgi:hypothetical protein
MFKWFNLSLSISISISLSLSGDDDYLDVHYIPVLFQVCLRQSTQLITFAKTFKLGRTERKVKNLLKRDSNKTRLIFNV